MLEIENLDFPDAVDGILNEVRKILLARQTIYNDPSDNIYTVTELVNCVNGGEFKTSWHDVIMTLIMLKYTRNANERETNPNDYDSLLDAIGYTVILIYIRNKNNG